jgi:uncharacterized protein (TIGR00369 family)
MTSAIDQRQPGWTAEEESEDAFSSMVGPLLSRADGGSKRYAFLAAPKHLNRYGRVHGGMLTWFADKSLSMKARETTGGAKLFATIQLDVQFMGAALGGSLVEAHCEISRTTGSMVFVTGRFVSGDSVVAAASGIWKYRREE